MSGTAVGAEPLSTELLEIMACPACSGKIAAESESSLSCPSCGERYPIENGTPRMLRRELRDLMQWSPGAKASAALADAMKARTARSFAFEWQQFHQLRAEWRRNFLGYMQPHRPEFFPGKRVLDAGCGCGRHSYYAAQFGAKVTAVDLSEAIDVARANTRGVGQVDTVQADIYHLPFVPESFDFIYSIGVLHHLPDPEGAFQNLLRYLKPGGEVQIYLYWQPQGQPIKRTLLAAVTVLRRLTTRLPHPLLHWLCYPVAGLAYLAFVLPYRLLRCMPGVADLAERIPMRQYADYPFAVCVNDQFDRFSAPIENRYTEDQVRGWLERAGLERIRVLPNWGWIGQGQKASRQAGG